MARIVAVVLCIMVTAMSFTHAQEGQKVFRKNKTEVSFKGLGKMTVDNAEMVTATMKRTVSDTKFKGEGFMKNLLSNMVMKSGSTDQIIDISSKMTTSIDHDKKQYREFPIMSFASSGSDATPEGAAEGTTDMSDEPERESDIRIIRQVFTVNETGRDGKKNKFQCKEYLVLWVMEWESISSGERGKDSVRTTIWSTEQTEKLGAAKKIDQQFTNGYLEAVGVNTNALADDALGLKWAEMFAQATKGKATYSKPDGDAMQELSKIKGMPVIVEGGYWPQRPKSMSGETAQEDDGADVSNPSKMLGRFAKKRLFGGKKKDKENEATITWKNEVKEVKVEKTKSHDFKTPDGYTKVQ